MTAVSARAKDRAVRIVDSHHASDPAAAAGGGGRVG